ncbi:MAG TPA: hypothetical protein VF244_10925 [Acidimicrobiales bacterium]
MPAYLRPLDRCQTCGAPATEQLNNGSNAPVGIYCDRHGKVALAEFRRRYEDPRLLKG